MPRLRKSRSRSKKSDPRSKKSDPRSKKRGKVKKSDPRSKKDLPYIYTYVWDIRPTTSGSGSQKLQISPKKL
jgi:hypothetical protein